MSQILVGEILHIHLARMQLSPRPEASCPCTTRLGDQIQQAATPTLETKFWDIWDIKYLRPNSQSTTEYRTETKPRSKPQVNIWNWRKRIREASVRSLRFLDYMALHIPSEQRWCEYSHPQMLRWNLRIDIRIRTLSAINISIRIRICTMQRRMRGLVRF